MHHHLLLKKPILDFLSFQQISSKIDCSPQFSHETDGSDENEEKADVEDDIHGKVIHPETDDGASSLNVDSFSNYNHSYHEEKSDQNSMKKIKILKAIIDDEKCLV